MSRHAPPPPPPPFPRPHPWVLWRAQQLRLRFEELILYMRMQPARVVDLLYVCW